VKKRWIALPAVFAAALYFFAFRTCTVGEYRIDRLPLDGGIEAGETLSDDPPAP
jgi:hypothetical protein